VRRADAIALVLGLLASACAQGEPPRLVVSPQAPAVANGAADAPFELRNTGGRPLALDGIVPACGCTPASHLPDTLAPGAAALFHVQCRPPAGTADVVRSLRIRSSDPTRPESELRVTLAPARTAPDPGALYFGYVAVGASAVRDVVLPVPFGDLAPTAVPDFTAEPLPDRADGAHVMRVHFTPHAAGVVRATLGLGPAAGALPVSAVAYAGVMAFPAELAAKRASGTGLPSVTLVVPGPESIALGRIDYPPGMSGELHTIVPGRQFRLLVRGHVAAAEAPGAIRIHAEAPNGPVIEIRVVDGTGSSQPNGPPA
jgi:hypothetical protein